MSGNPERTPVGFECRHVVYIPPVEGSDDDFHLAKVIAHFPDGSTEPQIKFFKNYERPLWITSKGNRNHEDKKEWEKLENVREFRVRESQKDWTVAKALGMTWVKNPRELYRNQYVYGTDILSTAVIKQEFRTRYPTLNTPYSVAAFDVETDVVKGTEQVIMATLSYKDRIITAVQKSFLEGHVGVRERAEAALVKYLGDDVQDRAVKWEFVVVDTEIDILKRCFGRAHEWRPDFVAIWNIDFDIQKLIGACERAYVDPADIFSDPKVPQKYRFFRYKQGNKQKKTASGKKSPIKPADQWHTVFAPASFYFIDAMCVYRKIRVAKGEEPSYALDYILDKNIKRRKLKFDAVTKTGLEWHIEMQQYYKFEYIVYNVFDCMGMELLDEKTKDLSIALPMQTGCSDFCNFSSQPRRTADAMHYFVQEFGYVFGSTSDRMANELDEETLDLKGWIVTLPAHLVADNGLCCIAEHPTLRTNIRPHVGDLDVSASYPNGECVFNVSKETTARELCSIEGVDEYIQRMEGINLSGGSTNAAEFCTLMYGMPTAHAMLNAFLEDTQAEFSHLESVDAETVDQFVNFEAVETVLREMDLAEREQSEEAA